MEDWSKWAKSKIEVDVLTLEDKPKTKKPPKPRVNPLLKRIEALEEAQESKPKTPISEIGSLVEATLSRCKNGKWKALNNKTLKIKKWMEDLAK